MTVVFANPAFGQLRTVERDGKILFCGKDAATALGYTNTKDALARHCKGVVKRYPLETAGGIQQVRFISEGDLYRLIVSSKLPAAQAFESWVFDEVLPSIRRRGGYLTPEATEAALTDPDFIIRLATSLKEERQRRAELETQAALNAPKVAFADAVQATDELISIGKLARMAKSAGVEIGQNRLFKWMRDHEWLTKAQQGNVHYNSPTQKALRQGVLSLKYHTFRDQLGFEHESITPLVTPKGQEFFIKTLLKQGV